MTERVKFIQLWKAASKERCPNFSVYNPLLAFRLRYQGNFSNSLAQLRFGAFSRARTSAADTHQPVISSSFSNCMGSIAGHHEGIKLVSHSSASSIQKHDFQGVVDNL